MSLDGQWWRSRTNPSAILQIIRVSQDGNVSVEMDGKRINCSLRYLRQNYKPLGDTE